MKRTLSLWTLLMGLLAYALLPALAQQTTGRVHGRVTNPVGLPQSGGTVSLSTNGGWNSQFTFLVSAAGDYAGEAAPGIYTLVYRGPETPAGKIVDSFKGVQIVAGQDVLQDVDMSRKEFVDQMPPEKKEELEVMKKKNAESQKTNAVIMILNADLKTAIKDFADANSARATAVQALGAGAAKADLDAREAEIQAAKFGEIETLMLKDVQVMPAGATLWLTLGQAQLGLKKYADAETAYKKVLELVAIKANLEMEGAANSGLGEVYARAGKVREANAAYHAAAKAAPSRAGFYLKNETVIFYQMKNWDAEAAAAEEAIQADPAQAVLYFLKAQGLLHKTTRDANTHRHNVPAGCTEAFQKYLELAPNGAYATESKDILGKIAAGGAGLFD
jgi:tetratricopeptide (TPR) repeat protein